MARRLKVFQARIGFYDTVVAAQSQKAALRAWGVHQNLFASGEARITQDAEALEAALARPEIPLRRAIGSADGFALDPTSLPTAPDIPRRKAAKAAAKSKAREKPPARLPPDRTGLNAAEAGLKAVEETRKREEADFRRRKEELDAAREAAQTAYGSARKAATRAVVEARRTYRKAGGSG